MITCPACGKENEDSAVLCRRCRGPLRDEPEEFAAEELAQHEASASAHSHEPSARAHEPPAHSHDAPAAGHSHDQQPAATADEPVASSDSLGEVCRRCESYNEPGARRCASCGYALISDAADPHPATADEPALDTTPTHPFAPPHLPADEGALLHDTPPEASRSVEDELSALALSPEEAAEAGLSMPLHDSAAHFDSDPFPHSGAAPSHDHEHALETQHRADDEPSLDKTPPQAFLRSPSEAPSLIAKGKAAVAGAAGVAVGAATSVAAGAAAAVVGAVRRAPPPPEPAAPQTAAAKAEPPPAVPLSRPEPAPTAGPAVKAQEHKACVECGALNPPAAKFCFDCGTPFAKKAAAPPPAPAEAQPKIVEPPIRAIELPKAPGPVPAAPKPAGQKGLAEAASVPPARVRGWADTTEPGAAAAPLHAGGLESTAETSPISLGAHGVHVEQASAHALDEAPEPAGGHAEPGHARGAETFAEAATAGLAEATPSAHSFDEPAAVEAGAHADDAALHEPAAFEEAAPHEAAAWDDPPAQAVEDLAEPLPEPAPIEELSEPLPEPAVEELAEPLPDPEPPFHATLVLEKGPAAGTALHLARLENSVGGAGAALELADDPSVAPHAATVAFAEDRLVLRDEGSANGVYVRIRDSAPLEAGDQFYAGERLLRFDGPCELPQTHEGEVPFLGAPRPPGVPFRLTEVVAGGRTGRTCHRSGPTVSIGRTGCDMNFPSDSLLGARHAEVRLSEDGTVSLVDLQQGPSGLFLRVRARGAQELQAGDVVRVGEQELRVEIG